MSLITDFRYAFRSLARAKGLVITVVVTLALGIGANAAIFSVVRGVLLRPLVNRDEDRLIYIRQSAQGLGQRQRRCSRSRRSRTCGRGSPRSTAFGEFSRLGSRWSAWASRASCVPASSTARTSRSWACGPVLGRLLGPADDGPNAAGAAVLTHRFWTTHVERRPVGDRQDGAVRRTRRPPSSASSSRRCPTRPKRRSSPTSSRARTTSRRRW